MNTIDIIPINIINRYVKEMTKEELKKITTKRDINNYFDAILKQFNGECVNRINNPIAAKIKCALIAGYQQLVMYRNTTDKEAMQKRFIDNIHIHVGVIASCYIPQVVIDDEMNTFYVEKPKL